MIRALVWDMGGVLVSVADLAPRRAMEKRLGLNPCELDEIDIDKAICGLG